MVEITLDEALAEMRKYGAAVHCERYRIYDKYRTDDTKCYLDRGCTVIIDENEYDGRMNLSYRVHQTSPDAEIDAVTADFKAKITARAAEYENVSGYFVSCVVTDGELPPEKDVFLGWRNFVRMGYRCGFDPRVRAMTAADSDIIDEACKPLLVRDTHFGRLTVESFIGYDFGAADDDGLTLYGIFDGGNPAGLATVTFVKPLDLAWLLDVYILPEYRQKGFGRAIVLSALSAYPDKKWHYQAARDNMPSIALAKSLGFTLEGAGLYVT